MISSDMKDAVDRAKALWDDTNNEETRRKLFHLFADAYLVTNNRLGDAIADMSKIISKIAPLSGRPIQLYDEPDTGIDGNNRSGDE